MEWKTIQLIRFGCASVSYRAADVRHPTNYRQISKGIIFSTRLGEKCVIGGRLEITGYMRHATGQVLSLIIII